MSKTIELRFVIELHDDGRTQISQPGAYVELTVSQMGRMYGGLHRYLKQSIMNIADTFPPAQRLCFLGKVIAMCDGDLSHDKKSRIILQELPADDA